MDSPESLLSEDWISQPRSSAPASGKNESSLFAHSSNASQSRIPRLTARSVSSPGLPHRNKSVLPQSPAGRRLEGALYERTASDLNVSLKHKSGAGKPCDSPISQLGRRQASGISSGTIAFGTVQHKISNATSPKTGKKENVTPEWKRRVMAAGGRTGKQQDLFSPIGLESVFTPPKPNQGLTKKSQQQKGRKYKSPATTEFPSSPPPYPPVPLEACGSNNKDVMRSPSAIPTVVSKSMKSSQQFTSFRGIPSSRSDKDVCHEGRIHAVQSRVGSGESLLRHEDISIVQMTDGKISYSSIDKFTPAEKQNTATRNASRNEKNTRRFSISSDSRIKYGDEALSGVSPSQCPDHTNQSLPDGESVNTAEFVAQKSPFVNLRRGGCAVDDSFQKRPLSPSSFQPSEVLAPDSDAPFRGKEGETVSTQSVLLPISPEHGPYTGKTPAAPATPKTSHESLLSPALPKSSGSPLKLFDKYDTYTNDRLARRLSQFVDNLPENPTRNTPEDEIQLNPSRRKLQHVVDHAQAPSFSGINSQRTASFGKGAFDNYSFTHYNSENCQQSSSDCDLEGLEYFPLPNMYQSSQMSKSSSRSVSATQTIARRGSLNESRRRRSDRWPPHHIDNVAQDLLALTDHAAMGQNDIKDLLNDEGKRIRHSPVRVSNSKRRRTINSSADWPVLRQSDDDYVKSAALQPIEGHRLKDAQHNGGSEVADPKLLASRLILGWRTPTLCQAQNKLTIAPKNTSARGLEDDDSVNGRAPLLNNQLSIVDAPTQALADELAYFALDVAQDITCGNRVTSVTTADFTSAANLIMQNIRAQARPRSGRTSGEDSAMEPIVVIEESINEGSTREEFSRPPSRVGGGTLRRSRDPRQVDPRVVSHLRRYEETDDTGIVVTSSITSVKIGVKNSSGEEDGYVSESDPPNVRIRSSQLEQSLGLVERPSNHEEISLSDHHHPNHGSQSSSGHSTSRTIPTGSSGSTGNKANIPPEKVSHLLSDHVAGMTFDRAKKIWIRRRSADSSDGEALPQSNSDMTDEDPLKEIPDLSVDEIEEMKRIKLTKSHPSMVRQCFNSRTEISKTEYTTDEYKKTWSDIRKTHSKQTDLSRGNLEASTAPGFDRPALVTTPIMEAPATSTAEQALAKSQVGNSSDNRQEPAHGPTNPEFGDREEEVEHEISILEGRSPTTPKRPNNGYRQPRVVTVAFSSPLVDSAHESKTRPYQSHEGIEIWEDDSVLDLDLEHSPEPPPSRRRQETSRRSISARYSSRSTPRSGRKVSVGRQNFTPRPISRIDEHDELFLVEDNGFINKSGLNVVLSTPRTTIGRQLNVSVPPPTSGMGSNITFHLSPLSDFTVNQRDECSELDIHDIAKHHGLLSVQEAESRYALAVKELVEKITDVEPFEPYWDYIRKLDLQSKNLVTLHKLDDFCGRIEELDVSDNKLCQLDGVPQSLRVLKVCGNHLSSLTSWAHLKNLQYLNVSGNKIRDLNAFRSLVHLRELTADDNQIGSLEGIAGLNGLIRLRLRRNILKYLDFEGFDLQRLSELDVQGNYIESIKNIHDLPTLNHLSIRDNKLSKMGGSTERVLLSLLVLDVSHNNITEIDVAHLPNLTTLCLDKNHATQIGGIQNLRSITNVSWREQTLERDTTIVFDDNNEISSLKLSGNKIHSFHPKASFLILQRLELASAGLESISNTFGLELPNLRFLNLNNNALKDIRPLLGIVKLAELHLAGNRVSRLRRTTAVLRKLGKTLDTLDCRSNPLTVGFYVSYTVTQNIEQQLVTNSKPHVKMATTDEVDDTIASTFMLRPADAAADQQHRERLDEDTALRRRVYEMLVLGGCPQLSQLDGLPMTRHTSEKRDGIWQRLVDLGVLQERVPIKTKGGDLQKQ